MRALYAAGLLLWATAVGFGVVTLWSYENKPGMAASAPGTWPEDTVIPHPHHRPTLVVLIHPQCSCSHATVGELERLQAHTRDAVDIYVLMLSPASVRLDWVQSPLWKKVAALDGITVVEDKDGRDAERFGTSTSGQALLYDESGQLVFSGGITASRGHEGDNAGRTAIEQLVRHEGADRSSTFVFGCALFGPAASADEGVTP
jgi:hypothetical protein